MAGPASALCGAVDMLRSTGLNAAQREILGTLSGAATVVLALVQDATNTYTGDAVDRQFELHVTPDVDLRASVLGQSLRILRLQDRFAAKLERVAIHTTVTPSVPTTVSIDVDRIRTCVMDLVGVAVDRAAPGSGIVVSADYLPADYLLAVAVRFTGKGLTDDEYSLLYPPVQPAGPRPSGAGVAPTPRQPLGALRRCE